VSNLQRALQCMCEIAYRTGRALPVLVLVDGANVPPTIWPQPALFDPIRWPREARVDEIVKELVHHYHEWRARSIVRTDYVLVKRLAAHLRLEKAAFFDEVRTRLDALFDEASWAAKLGLSNGLAPRRVGESEYAEMALAASRVRNLHGDSDEAALAAIPLLFKPSDWPWLSAGSTMMPAWFPGVERKYEPHHLLRLVQLIASRPKNGWASVDVFGTTGTNISRELELIFREIQEGKGQMRNLVARMLLLGETDFRPRPNAHLNEAMRRAGVRVSIRRYPSSVNVAGGAGDPDLIPVLRLPPFHGNANGWIDDWKEGIGDQPLQVVSHGPERDQPTPDYEFLYLGYMTPQPEAHPHLYMYFDRHRPVPRPKESHQSVFPPPLDQEASPLWYREVPFTSFQRWFDLLWPESTSLGLEFGR
jgi:hypothetical protein